MTKDAILDVAERLFAIRGVLSTSLRQVAQESGVDAASISYHFGNKEDVLKAVITRRYELLREPRMVALTDLLDRSRNNPTAREILDAMFRSWFENSIGGDPGWRYYSKLVAHMMIIPGITEIIEGLAGYWEQTQLNAFRLANPEASDEQILWALSLSLGTSYFFFTETPRLDTMSKGRFHSRDIAIRYDLFLNFVSGGYEAAINTIMEDGEETRN